MRGCQALLAIGGFPVNFGDSFMPGSESRKGKYELVHNVQDEDYYA